LATNAVVFVKSKWWVKNDHELADNTYRSGLPNTCMGCPFPSIVAAHPQTAGRHPDFVLIARSN
jgi:hypothetical protein